MSLKYFEYIIVIILTNQQKQRQTFSHMNELPIVILSKELKYSLSQEKVKTLEKAIELLPKLGENQENKRKVITKLSNKYNQIKSNIAKEFARMFSPNQIIKGESTQQMIRPSLRVASNPFYDFLLSNPICEIYGPKGSGKTCLLLNFAQEFAFANKPYKNSTKITIMNCVSGITFRRLEKLHAFKQQGMQIQILEIATLEDIIKLLSKMKDELGHGQIKKSFIAIDMMVLLFMAREKSKIYVSKIFQIIAQIVEKYSCAVVFTNLVQHKFQLGNEEIYNHASYNSQLSAEHLTHKFYLERPEKASAGRFKLTNLKGQKLQAYFQIGISGIKQLQSINNE